MFICFWVYLHLDQTIFLLFHIFLELCLLQTEEILSVTQSTIYCSSQSCWGQKGWQYKGINCHLNCWQLCLWHHHNCSVSSQWQIFWKRYASQQTIQGVLFQNIESKCLTAFNCTLYESNFYLICSFGKRFQDNWNLKEN